MGWPVVTVERMTDLELDEWLADLQPPDTPGPKLELAPAGTVPGAEHLPNPGRCARQPDAHVRQTSVREVG